MEANPLMKLVRTCCLSVRWGDMDAYGHVNNTVYFRYMEQVRIEWLASFFDLEYTSNTGPVLIDAHCSFLRPLKYPDQIEVQMYIAQPGRSSFNTYYQIYRLNEEKIVCAEGSGKVVWVDHALGKSMQLPEIILNQF